MLNNPEIEKKIQTHLKVEVKDFPTLQDCYDKKNTFLKALEKDLLQAKKDYNELHQDKALVDASLADKKKDLQVLSDKNVALQHEIDNAAAKAAAYDEQPKPLKYTDEDEQAVVV